VLEMCETGKIPAGDHLIVESLDRISRDKVLNALEVFIRILKCGVILHTFGDRKIYTEVSVNNNVSDLLVSITIMIRANEESSTKARRQRQKWEQKRKEATTKKLTRRAPAWLTPVLDSHGNVVNFEEHPERVKIVTQIFEELANGIGRDKIARRLNAAVRQAEKEGKDTADLRPWGHGGIWRGREWHGGTVQKITDSRAVLGEFQPGRTILVTEGEEVKRKRVKDGEVIPGYYPRIIDDELWFRARRAADSRKQTKVMNTGGRKGTVYSNLFSGFAFCVACGSPMNYRDRGPRSTVVLRCSGNRNGTCENGHPYPYKPLENAVLDWVRELDLPETGSPEVKELEAEIASQTFKRDKLAQEAETLVREFQGGSRTATKRVMECEAEIDLIDECLGKLRKRLDGVKGDVAPTERAAQIADLRERMSKAAGENLFAIRAGIAQALRNIVQKLAFHLNGWVSIVLAGGKQYVFANGEIHSVFDWTNEASPVSFWVPEGLEAPKLKLNVPDNFEAIHRSVIEALDEEGSADGRT